MENKQRICELLLPALQETRNLHDLANLTYDEEREVVIAEFTATLSSLFIYYYNYNGNNLLGAGMTFAIESENTKETITARLET